MAETLYLIDGHAQTYRAFYAVEGLTAPDGRPTGAVFGFERMLRDTIRQHEPDHIAVVFDSPAPSFRKELFPAYKATRRPAPRELLDQLPVIEKMVAAHRIPVYRLDGYEADDLIGALARQARAQGLEVVLVTSDKDLAQLLAPGVRLYDPRKDAFTDEEAYSKAKGFPPRLLPDVMGLWGDASDNIPGVPGVGEKIAAEWIGKYGSLDELLAHADEIPGKRGTVLREHLEQARLSRRLATIDCEAPVTLDLPACRRTSPDAQRLLALYEELGFERLKQELASDGVTAAQRPAEERRYGLIATPEEFQRFLSLLQKQRAFAVDTETTGTDPLRADLVGMSFSWEERTGWYLPFRAPGGEPALGPGELRALAPILEDESSAKTGHNLKYDDLVLRRHGVRLRGIAFDSMLASHLFAGHLRGHSLDATAERYLRVTTIHIEEVIGKGKKQITMDQAPLSAVLPYAAEDADIAFRLERYLRPRIEAAGQRELFESLELPLAGVLAGMQERGVRLDVGRLAAMSRDMEAQLDRLTGEIHFLAGREFNIASPKQLAEILFDELGFPVVRKTKTGRSTDEAVLTELAATAHPKHALPRRLLDFRMYSKLKSTYLDALPALVHPETGRLHTTFHQTGTMTGRLSSSDPNLQNIPVRTEEGRGVRAAFVPAEGWRMLAADYSQIELRLVAHLSGDERLGRALREGQDIHTAVAADIFGHPADEVTADERRAAKAVNFGIVYGQTAFGLSQATEMSRFEAKDFIETYFSNFPGVRDFIQSTIDRAHEEGRVRTLLGRAREIPDLASQNKSKRQQAERMAVNTVVQGSAADLIKTAMIRIDRRLAAEKLEARMLLQIHDELLFECPPEEETRLGEIVRAEMEGAMELSVPLSVDLGAGANWLEAK